jgi:hypothetical protein
MAGAWHGLASWWPHGKTRRNWLPWREPVPNRARQTCYRTSTTFAAAMAPKTRSRGMIPTLRARPNARNRGRPSAPASSLTTRKVMRVNTAMSPRDAAIPTAVVIVDTVVVVTVDIITSPAFHDDSRFVCRLPQVLITCQRTRPAPQRKLLRHASLLSAGRASARPEQREQGTRPASTQAAALEANAPVAGQSLDAPEAHVVAMASVGLAGIAQADH